MLKIGYLPLHPDVLEVEITLKVPLYESRDLTNGQSLDGICLHCIRPQKPLINGQGRRICPPAQKCQYL